MGPAPMTPCERRATLIVARKGGDNMPTETLTKNGRKTPQLTRATTVPG
jgi:hypothetical protein